MALAYDSLTASTLNRYRRRFTDNLFNSHPLLFWLKENGRVSFEPGGPAIVEPLLYTEGDNVQMYDRYDAISFTPVETLTAAEFRWRYLAAPIVISGPEMLENSGPDAAVKLINAKVTQAEETVNNALSRQLFASASSVGPKDIHSLDQLINNFTGYNQPVGGIGAADGAGWWEAYYEDATSISASDVDLRRMITHAKNSCSKGSKREGVDLVLGGQLAYEQYEADLVPTMRRTSTKLADAGFENLLVAGVPFVWDWNCPNDKVFGISSKYMGLVGHKERWFKMEKFDRGVSTNDGGTGVFVDANAQVILSALNLTVRNRRRHFQIDNINFS